MLCAYASRERCTASITTIPPANCLAATTKQEKKLKLWQIHKLVHPRATTNVRAVCRVILADSKSINCLKCRQLWVLTVLLYIGGLYSILLSEKRVS